MKGLPQAICRMQQIGPNNNTVLEQYRFGLRLYMHRPRPSSEFTNQRHSWNGPAELLIKTGVEEDGLTSRHTVGVLGHSRLRLQTVPSINVVRGDYRFELSAMATTMLSRFGEIGHTRSYVCGSGEDGENNSCLGLHVLEFMFLRLEHIARSRNHSTL